MKKKIGELYDKPIVIGNKNEVEKHEIHIDELNAGGGEDGAESNRFYFLFNRMNANPYGLLESLASVCFIPPMTTNVYETFPTIATSRGSLIKASCIKKTYMPDMGEVDIEQMLLPMVGEVIPLTYKEYIGEETNPHCHIFFGEEVVIENNGRDIRYQGIRSLIEKLYQTYGTEPFHQNEFVLLVDPSREVDSHNYEFWAYIQLVRVGYYEKRDDSFDRYDVVCVDPDNLGKEYSLNFGVNENDTIGLNA